MSKKVSKKVSNFQSCKICNKKHGKTLLKTYEHYDKCVEEGYGHDIHGYLVRLFAFGTIGTYFMYLSVGHNCTLNDLDNFIRTEWCSCCMHLSNFLDENGKETSKKTKISNIGINGKILYEFDMGDSTDVYIEIVKYFDKDDNSNRLISKKCKSVFKLSPDAPLCSCNNKALYFGDDEPLCQSCMEKSKCDRFYKIVDSPRVGMCGFEMIENENDNDV